MKIVVNSAYGYLGAARAHAFRRRARRQRSDAARSRSARRSSAASSRARGVTLLEADTDGVYFAVPERLVARPTSAASSPRSRALLPPRVELEFDGRYAAMLSHEPKNYALLPYAAGR